MLKLPMKKTLFALLGLSALILFSCNKEDELHPEFPFTVVVKTLDDSVAVNNVKVEVFTPVQNNSVEMVGYTDAYGRVSFEYDLEAVLLVQATRGENPISYIGCADVRLEPNKEVVQNIYLEVYDPNVPGCVYTP